MLEVVLDSQVVDVAPIGRLRQSTTQTRLVGAACALMESKGNLTNQLLLCNSFITSSYCNKL